MFDHFVGLALKGLVYLMFGVNVFRSLLERRVKTENHLSTLAVGVVVNTEIFMSFIKLYF